MDIHAKEGFYRCQPDHLSGYDKIDPGLENGHLWLFVLGGLEMTTVVRINGYLPKVTLGKVSSGLCKFGKIKFRSS